MLKSAADLRRDVLRIWQAGLDAVRSDRLVRNVLRFEDGLLFIDEQPVELAADARICVVGAGKAGAGMARAVEDVFSAPEAAGRELTGWVNVPADCVPARDAAQKPTSRIHLHPARPAGVNEPTEAGVAGTEQILRLVGSLRPHDLCLALWSGGGSALLPGPVSEVSLADKLAVTRHLSAAGANIEQLNTVRKQLSRVKGGGLARACTADRLYSLIISDVLGDPLDVIASGPTVPDQGTPELALSVLAQFGPSPAEVPSVYAYLRSAQARPAQPRAKVSNLVIGNNALAVDAAGQEAVALGYSPAMVSARQSEGLADDIGRHLADMAAKMRTGGPDCLISGGEPVVRLAAADRRGKGGRNQQLVLAAYKQLGPSGCEQIALLSGGTDGEDGPTDAAGAVLDADLARRAVEQGLSPDEYLARNDAYHFFAALDGLVSTGPTHTNVCDVRVVLVGRNPS